MDVSIDEAWKDCNLLTYFFITDLVDFTINNHERSRADCPGNHIGNTAANFKVPCFHLEMFYIELICCSLNFRPVGRTRHRYPFLCLSGY